MQKSGLVCASICGAHVLRDEVCDVGGAAALADRLPIDDHHCAVSLEEQVVGAEVEVHEGVRHRRESIQDLRTRGRVVGNEVGELGLDAVRECCHEPWQRRVVNRRARLVQRTVDDWDEDGVFEVCAVPKSRVVCRQPN